MISQGCQRRVLPLCPDRRRSRICERLVSASRLPWLQHLHLGIRIPIVSITLIALKPSLISQHVDTALAQVRGISSSVFVTAVSAVTVPVSISLFPREVKLVSPCLCFLKTTLKSPVCLSHNCQDLGRGSLVPPNLTKPRFSLMSCLA